jgi:hypothetical protein
MLTNEMLLACSDELLKIAATRASMTVAQSRLGRRPMRVATMLQKEKDGTLFKQSGAMGSTGSSDGAPGVLPYEDSKWMGTPAKTRKRRWEVPSVDDPAVKHDRVEGRDQLATQVGPNASMGSTGIAYSNSGVEQ